MARWDHPERRRRPGRVTLLQPTLQWLEPLESARLARLLRPVPSPVHRQISCLHHLNVNVTSCSSTLHLAHGNHRDGAAATTLSTLNVAIQTWTIWKTIRGRMVECRADPVPLVQEVQQTKSTCRRISLTITLITTTSWDLQLRRRRQLLYRMAAGRVTKACPRSTRAAWFTPAVD